MHFRIVPSRDFRGCPHSGGSSRQPGGCNLKKSIYVLVGTWPERKTQGRTSKASEWNQGASMYFYFVPKDPCLTQLLLCSNFMLCNHFSLNPDQPLLYVSQQPFFWKPHQKIAFLQVLNQSVSRQVSKLLLLRETQTFWHLWEGCRMQVSFLAFYSGHGRAIGTSLWTRQQYYG